MFSGILTQLQAARYLPRPRRARLRDNRQPATGIAPIRPPGRKARRRATLRGFLGPIGGVVLDPGAVAKRV
jgi:hypothetical protein